MKKILLLTLLLTHVSYASQEDKKENSNSFLNIDNTLDKIENKIEIVSNKLNQSSKYIDEYITNETDNSIYTDSFIRIENSIEKIESQDIEYEPNIDIRLKLPKLKDKLLLTIDNNDEVRINEEFQDSNEKINNKDDHYNIGLLYNTVKKDFNLKFKISLKAAADPYIYTQGLISKNFLISENSNITVQEKLRYSHKHKFDNYLSFNYYHKINDTLSFHNYNEYHINSELKNDNTHNSLRIHQKLTKKRFLNYVIAVESNDYKSSFKTKEYSAYVSYREYIRKWLYYDIVPSVNWYREDDFDRNIGLKFNLGILIGK